MGKLGNLRAYHQKATQKSQAMCIPIFILYMPCSVCFHGIRKSTLDPCYATRHCQTFRKSSRLYKFRPGTPLNLKLSPMGFCYRKSMNLGPFRVNLSKSGLGAILSVVADSALAQRRVGKTIASPAPYGSRPFWGGSSIRLPSGRPTTWFILQHHGDGSWLSQIWCWLPCAPRWHTRHFDHRLMA